MIEQGLVVKPEFENLSEYLEFGERTKGNKELERIVEKINGVTEGLTIRELLLWMNRNTTRIHNKHDNRKFKRNAVEILLSRERTGCCDSSTLFTALARTKNIPTMQIITFNKEEPNNGHFFTGCYLKNKEGKGEWVLIDTDSPIKDVRDVVLLKLNKEKRNIDRRYYAYAYVNDYANVEYEGIKMDCISNLVRIQRRVYEQCDKKDFKEEYYRE